MTLIEQAQFNILALVTTALEGVPYAEAKPAAFVRDVFELNTSRKPTVYVVYEYFRLAGDQVVGRHGGVASGRELWSLACVASNLSDAMAAAKTAWALVEAVRGIRERDYAPTGSSGPRYLRFAGPERPIESPDRTARGGALGFVVPYESSVHRI